MTPRWKRWFFGDRRRPVVRLWALLVPTIILLAALPLLRPVRLTASSASTNDQRLLVASARAVAERGTLTLATDPRPLLPGTLGRGDALVVRRGVEREVFGGLPGDVAPSTASSNNEARVLHGVLRTGDRLVARQPPVLSVILGGIALGLNALGWSAIEHAERFAGLLTFFGVTLPVALAGGLLYRMARVFELSRPARATVALVAIFAGGVFADALVLGPRGPAAAAVVGALALVIHLGAARRPGYATLWMPAAGLCAGFALTLAPVTGVLIVLLPIAVLMMPLRRRLKLVAAGLLIVGVTGPVVTHVLLARSIGDVRFPWASPSESATSVAWEDEIDTPPAPNGWASVGPFLRRALLGALIEPTDDAGVANARIINPSRGPNESVFDRVPDDEQTSAESATSDLLRGDPIRRLGRLPLILLAVAGVIGVLRRNWTGPLKLIAAGILVGGVVAVLTSAALFPTLPNVTAWSATVFAPALLFWTGMFLRRPHGPVAHATFAATAALGVAVTLLTVLRPAPLWDGDHPVTAVASGRQ